MFLAIAVAGSITSTAFAASEMKHDVKDTKITAMVKAELLKQSNINSMDISVETVTLLDHSSRIELSGTQNTNEQKDLAEKTAKAVAKKYKNVTVVDYIVVKSS